VGATAASRVVVVATVARAVTVVARVATVDSRVVVVTVAREATVVDRVPVSATGNSREIWLTLLLKTVASLAVTPEVVVTPVVSRVVSRISVWRPGYMVVFQIPLIQSRSILSSQYPIGLDPFAFDSFSFHSYPIPSVLVSILSRTMSLRAVLPEDSAYGR
jgi:hypothetical protein